MEEEIKTLFSSRIESIIEEIINKSIEKNFSQFLIKFLNKKINSWVKSSDWAMVATNGIVGLNIGNGYSINTNLVQPIHAQADMITLFLDGVLTSKGHEGKHDQEIHQVSFQTSSWLILTRF